MASFFCSSLRIQEQRLIVRFSEEKDTVVKWNKILESGENDG